MRDQRRNPRNFGVSDKPRCPNCGVRMFLTRRSPAADYALQYERQKFTCPECDHEIERVVDADGKPMQFAGTQSAHR
jgi:DNA-directed RNA polymerase subunit RPC12/RpoP